MLHLLVERNGEGFRIRMGGDWLDADRVVLACDAHRAAKLVPDARIADLLETVRYGSSMTVAFGFTMRDFPRPLDSPRPLRCPTWYPTCRP